MKNSFNRREFLKTSTVAAGAVVAAFPSLVRGQNLNSKLKIAGIGIGGMGGNNLRNLESENTVSTCDEDHNYAGLVIKLEPGATLYTDYRVVTDKHMGFGDVLIVTPGLTHAVK